MEPYFNRAEAGRELAQHLTEYQDRGDAVVFALPRGGVPVAFEVAEALHLPLDVFVVRKLGLPGHKELALGAIASGGVLVLNHDVVRDHGASEEDIRDVAATEWRELERRERLYRCASPPLNVEGRIVILVDDGLATGSSMLAAIRAVKARQPAKVAAAVPVGAASTCAWLRGEADQVVCANALEMLYSVGMWYRDYTPTSDEEVRELLERAEHARAAL